MAVVNERPNLARKVQKGALWSGANTVLMRLATIAITAVVVRIVSPEDFGVFAVAATVFTVVSSFGELGMSSCLARRDMDPKTIAPTVTLISLASGAALATLMAVTAAPLAIALGAPDADSAIRVLSLCILLGGLFTVPSSLLVRDFRQGRIFLANIIAFVPSNLLLVVLALHGNGAMAFAWSRLFGTAIVGITMLVSVKRYWPGLDRTQVLPVLRFGLPLAGANLLNYTLLNADYVFVGRQMGAALLGIYVLAYNVASWPTSVLAGTINSVAMPAFSRFQGDRAGLRDSLESSLRIVSFIAFPICAMTLALASQIVATLYGEQWNASAPILMILAVYGGIFIVTLLFANMLVGIGRAGKLFLVQFFWILALIPTMWFGVHIAGLTGAALAHIAIILAVALPLYAWALNSVVHELLRLLIRGSALLMAASALAGFAAWLVNRGITNPTIGLIVGGAVGGCVYAILALPFMRRHLTIESEQRLAGILRIYDRTLRRTTR